jgi:DNA-binding NtrC family response regulator
VVLGAEGLLESRYLPPGFGRSGERVAEIPTYENAIRIEIGSTIDYAERILILKTLESHGNNKTRAAETLGISLKTLHNKLKEYGSAVEVAAEASEEQ